MKKLLLLFLLSMPSLAATVNVNTGMTGAQIQAAINSSTSGDTISFAAGTYNLPSNGSNSNGAALNLLAGRIYTGPTSGSAARLLGTGVYPLLYFSGTTITIQFLTLDHGGLFLENFVTSASIVNNTFQNIDCGVNASQTTGIFINGGLNNSDISSNTFQNLGQTCNAQYQNSQGAGGIQMYGFHNLTITHNTFNTVYEGIAIVISNSAQFDGAGGKILNNTFTQIHRMAIEMLGTTTNPSGLEVAYTNYSNALLPWAYTFGLSLTAGQNMIVHDNIINGNTQASSGNYVPYGVEIGGVNSSAYNNVVEGYWGWGFAIGTNGPISISNNRICGPSMAVAPNSGSVPVPGNANGYISWEASAGTGTFTGNVTSASLTCEVPPPACHAAGPANTGSGSGVDWNNVMKLPTAPVRGDTYYLKDGSYGTYTPTTATSGTSRITIKKAQSYDYGRTSDGCSNDISAGWNPATMGAAQAVFSGTGGTVSTTGGQGYYTFDGNGKTTTAGCGVSPAVNAAASDCGIKMQAASTSASTYGVLWVNSNYNVGVTRATGWIIRYVELVGAGDAGNTITNSNEHTFYCRNGCNNLLFEHNYMHESACDFIDTPYGDTATYNLNHFKQNASSANCHGQFWLGDGNQMDNFTFSNNLIQDIQGTGYWSILNGGDAANWNIYNNIIFQTSGSSRPGISSGTFVVANSGSSATGINLIDNTWVGDKTDYSNHFTAYCDGTCTGTYTERGSLYFGIIDSQDSINPSPVAGPGVFPNAVESYNSVINSGTVNFGYTGTGDIKATGQANPFVNWPSYNFNLTGNGTNVNSSLSLSTPFNVDAAGNARPSGGTWNRGALQFVAGPPAAACTLVKNEPQYGYNTLPGSQRYLIVHETGCPTAPISNIVMTGSTSAATVTFTVPNASIFTVGKTVTTTGFTDYPFNQFFQGGAFVITAASGTSVTATYNNAFAVAGSTAVSGPMLIQSSRVNWSTSAGTLSCTSNCLPIANLTTDSAAGNLSTVQPNTPYPSGGYTMTSTHQITVTATSVDNPASSVTYTVNQASETTQVVIAGAQYTQAYSGQYRQIWTNVLGNVNQNVTWSITTQPAGGDATLSNTNKRNTLFKATVAGRYKVTATSVDDPTKSAYEIIDVTAAGIPSYAAAPPSGAGPQACFVASGQTAYEVGPTQTYHNLNDVPWRTLPQGAIVRVHNEDTTGSSPTTYKEYLQVLGIFTPDLPLQICGVPDSSGNLPVMDGNQAHGPTWWSNIFLYGAGMIVTNPTTSCVVSADPSGSCGPTHVRIAGIKIIHANPSYSFYQADGTTLSPWGGDAVDVRTGAYITVEGTRFELTSQGVGTYANQNGNYPALSQSVLWAESYTGQNGVTNNATAHPGYLQSLNGNVVDRVYVAQGVTGDQGSCIKARGQGNIFANIFCDVGFSRGIDFVEAQDDSAYIDFTQAMFQGGLYNLGGFDLNLEAARQESNFKDYVFGSVLKSNNNHYLMDHDDQIGNVGMNGRYGNLYFWYNTSIDPGILIDTGNQFNLNYFLNEKINISNSILWQSTGSWGINDFTMTAFNMQKNVMNTASMDNTTPIWGTPGVFGANGWLGKTQENAYVMNRPLESHITGNLTTDFIKTGTTPYSTPSYAPPFGSAAIGVAGTLTGEMASFELTYNAMSIPGVYVRRTTPTTIGAMDPTSGTPTLSSIAISPAGPVNLLFPVTLQMQATCTYSDSSTTNCTNSVAWSNGGSSSFTVGASGLISTLHVNGSGTLSASLLSIHSNNVIVNVAVPPPPIVKFGAGAKIGVGSGSSVKVF